MKLLKAITLVLVFLTLESAQAQAKKINYQLSQLSDNTYVITRSWDQVGKFRNNVGFIVGEKGITLINTMFASEIDQLLAVIRQVSDKPIKYVFNSNWDFHNTDANAKLIEMGATVVSHQNLKYFENTTTQLTFDDSIEVNIGNDSIIAYRSGGHSFGHINILIKNANVMFMSDSYRDQWMTTSGPFGYNGHISALKSALQLTNKNTKFVPGNTSSSVFVTADTIKQEIEIRKSFISQVTKLESDGMSVKEIAANQNINQLFSINYERYPEYGKDLSGRVRAGLYGNRVQSSKIDEQKLKEYLGHYELPDGRLVEVLIEDSHLVAKSEGAFMFLLLPVANDNFEFGWHFTGRRISFVRNDTNSIIGFRVNMRPEDERYGQERILKHLRTLDLIKRVNG